MEKQTYGLWEVLAEAPRRGKRNDRSFTCRCACGVVRDVMLHNLASGASTSCGCEKKRLTALRSTTHGLSKTRVYRVWLGMHERCYYTKHKSYAYYGARGVVVCRRWHTFENFLADMGEPPKGLSLDRKNNERGYTPSNCFWATREEQMNNTRATRRLAYKGRTQTLAQWAAELGVTKRAMQARIKHGWSIEKICSTPHQRLPKE